MTEEPARGVTIREAYSGYTPPISARSMVERLIGGLPEKYVAGLHSIVLTNASGLNRKGRKGRTLSRKRKVAIVKSRGLYHPRWQGEPAWIEIYVDNALARWPTWLLWIPLLRDIPLAQVLFHELGHHIHKTRAPEHREREDAADQWHDRLARVYFKRRYWFLLPAVWVLAPFARRLERWLTRRSTRAAK